jgi:transcriptional regulator with XRE-family HTH domain
MKQLGFFLRKLRKSKRLTMAAVAKKIREKHPKERHYWLSVSNLSWIENGKIAVPSPLMLKALAEVYGIDYHEIYTLAGYEEPAVSKKVDDPDGLLRDYLHHAGVEYITKTDFLLVRETLNNIIKLIQPKNT